MKITCNAKELARCLKVLKPVLGSKLWIKATGASVKLLCDLSEIAISLKVANLASLEASKRANAEIAESGVACLWYKDLAQIIGSSRCAAGSVIISSEGGSVTIEMAGVVYTLPLLDDEVPVIRCKGSQTVKLELREPFMRLKKFIGDGYYPKYHNIYLDSTHALKAVATDGRILQARSVKGNDPPEGFGGLIPYQACVLLMDKAWDGKIAVRQDEQRMWFKKPGIVMSVETKRDDFAWQEVIAKALINPIHITVDREQLIDAVRLVNRVNHNKRAPIRFELVEGIIAISSGLGDRIAGTAIDVLNPFHVSSLDPTAVNAASDEVTFDLNSEYTLICLRSIISDEVTFRVKDSESEIYISGGSDEQTVIMPIKVR